MENLALGRIAALVPEFAVKDCPWAEHMMIYNKRLWLCMMHVVVKHLSTGLGESNISSSH